MSQFLERQRYYNPSMMILWNLLLIMNLRLLQNPGLLGATSTINSSLKLISTDTVSAFPCNWRIITFECTVDGGTSGGSTVWKGTVFSGCDDTNEEIILLHSRFSGETDSIQCNTSHITLTGRSIGVRNNSYISQLEVLVKPGLNEMPLKSVTCAHDDGTAETVVDSITINTSYICTSSEDLLNDSAINYTTTLAMEGTESQVLELDIIIISSTLSLLFMVLFIVPLLLCGLYKKFRSKPIGDRMLGENIRQAIRYEAGGCVEIMKSFDNESTLGIYSLSDTENFTVQGDTSSCNLKHSLVCALRGQVSSKWYTFGLALGVPKQFLNQLKCDSDEECLDKVLDYWLKQHPGKPTWQEVMDAKNRIASSKYSTI